MIWKILVQLPELEGNCPHYLLLATRLVSKVSGLVSVSKATGLETKNNAKKWCSKIFIIQRFFVCCICRWEKTKSDRKMPEIIKDSTMKWWRHLLKYFGTMHKFWNLGLEFQVSRLSLGIFDEVAVSKFQPALGLGVEGYGLDNITDNYTLYLFTSTFFKSIFTVLLILNTPNFLKIWLDTLRCATHTSVLVSSIRFCTLFCVCWFVCLFSNCAYIIFICCFPPRANKFLVSLVDKMTSMVFHESYVTEWQSF